MTEPSASGLSTNVTSTVSHTWQMLQNVPSELKPETSLCPERSYSASASVIIRCMVFKSTLSGFSLGKEVFLAVRKSSYRDGILARQNSSSMQLCIYLFLSLLVQEQAQLSLVRRQPWPALWQWRRSQGTTTTGQQFTYNWFYHCNYLAMSDP